MDVYKELVKSFLPEGILEYFELTGLEKEGEHLRLYLREKDSIPEIYKGHPHRSNGFMEEIKVKDFPIRELFVTLHIKRRRWLLIDEQKKVSRDWNLVAPGTRMTSEFSDFLKEIIR